MCRLFALHAGDRDVAADFWLLDAPDSIARQSEINADGYGLAALTSKHGLILMRNPVEAAGDMAYQAVAHRLVAAEMICTSVTPTPATPPLPTPIRSPRTGGCSPTTASSGTSTRSRRGSAKTGRW
jgi:hypothetical protein